MARTQCLLRFSRKHTIMPHFNALILKFVTKITQCSRFSICCVSWLFIQLAWLSTFPKMFHSVYLFECRNFMSLQIIVNWRVAIYFAISPVITAIIVFIHFYFYFCNCIQGIPSDNDTHLSWCVFHFIFVSFLLE